jgi:hypothetical protein
VPPLQGGSRGFESLIAHPQKAFVYDRGFFISSLNPPIQIKSK